MFRATHALMCVGDLPKITIIFIGIIISMASGVIPMHVAAAAGAILVVLTKCITIEEAVSSFSVPTLFLVAGIFPLSTALVETGATEYLVNWISPYFINLSPVFIIMAVTFFVILITQFLMNTSLTAIMVPVGILVAEAANIDPAGVVMAIAIAASIALATPFGTGPNLLVWEVGGYQVKDYFKVGFPLTLILGIVITIACSIIYL